MALCSLILVRSRLTDCPTDRLADRLTRNRTNLMSKACRFERTALCHRLLPFRDTCRFRLKIFFPSNSNVVKAGKFICPFFAFTTCIFILAPTTNPQGLPLHVRTSTAGRVLTCVQRTNLGGSKIIGHTVPFQALIIGFIVWYIYTAVVLAHWPTRLPENTSRNFNLLCGVYIVFGILRLYWQVVQLRRENPHAHAHEPTHTQHTHAHHDIPLHVRRRRPARSGC